MAVIKLTQGYRTIVDDHTADLFKMLGWADCWFASVERNGVYAKANLPDGRLVRLHRLILGAPDGIMVDHWDGDGLNNRDYNLRLATRSQNTANSVKISGSAGFRGVDRLASGLFRARIKLQGRRINLGHHKTAIEAAQIYEVKRLELFGEFAPDGRPQTE